LGDILPVFWLRDPVAQRLLGEPLVGLKQRQQVTALATDLQQRATEFTADFHLGEQSQFQFAAFEAFVARCQRENRRVVACCGQLNPLLGNALDPQMRSSMREFLRGLAARYDHFILLDESRLPAQQIADYEDLTHVAQEARKRFTVLLAQVLQGL
jgi:hypothetical protein